MALTRRGILTTTAGVAAAASLPRAALAQPVRTLVVAMPTTPEGLDGDVLKPGTVECVPNCYDALVAYRRKVVDGRPYLDHDTVEPLLAESWTEIDGGRRYLFKLRPGIKSHRGNELTAADVEWSWAKSFAQKRTGVFIANVSNVTAVKATAKYEVEFALSAPSSIFLKALTLYVPGVYDTTEVKSHATADDPWALKWLDSNTAGFGPYYLEALRPGEQAVFVTNPNYFRDKPFFGRVVYRAVPSAASRITLLKSGQAHWIDRPSIQHIIDLKKDPKVKVESAPGRAMASVRMNVTIKPFDDIRVRHALNYALDRDALNQAVFFDLARPARSLLPPHVSGFDESGFHYTFDQAKAKALLADAGHPNGFEAELIYSDIWWWEEALAIQVSSQMKAVGINLKPTRITGSELRSRGAPARQDLPLFTWEEGPIVLDPVYTFYLMGHTKGISNRTRYSSPRVDELVEAGRQELDRARREAMMREAQRIWVEDAPWLMTHYLSLNEAMAANIVGWTPYPDDQERWYDLRLA